jgi:hypothetical protein
MTWLATRSLIDLTCELTQGWLVTTLERYLVHLFFFYNGIVVYSYYVLIIVIQFIRVTFIPGFHIPTSFVHAAQNSRWWWIKGANCIESPCIKYCFHMENIQKGRKLSLFVLSFVGYISTPKLHTKMHKSDCWWFFWFFDLADPSKSRLVPFKKPAFCVIFSSSSTY